MEKTDFKDGEFYDLKLSELIPSEEQPRKFFCLEAHKQLKDSIKNNQMFDAILFTINNDNLVIVSGERRCRAMKDLGEELIRGRYIADPKPELPLIANLQREDLLPVEKAEALSSLKEKFGHSHEYLANILGKSISTISEIIKLNTLPEDIKSECKKSKRFMHYRLLQIANAPNHRAMRSQFKKYVRELDGKSKKRNPRPKSGIISITKRLDCIIKDIEKIELKIMNHAELNTLRETIEKFENVVNKLCNFEDSSISNHTASFNKAILPSEYYPPEETTTLLKDCDQIDEDTQKIDIPITYVTSEFRSTADPGLETFSIADPAKPIPLTISDNADESADQEDRLLALIRSTSLACERISK
ncbi:ParB/RepB/Spo0J family partition protein [Pelotalea chapellei]|uniref:ParB/RepB/Spo0J family partition protein n=1 Tax=Pelotalea chapellei TaxID=44671 RepID=A0ABS5U3R5_9BACT|nr:ParB/RepB/Spo0J family partition protein [Pelotalea chapellei]MBT1070308.1 ParB/RepB/Spo0J family partition protein [Pelotalea chapellei]